MRVGQRTEDDRNIEARIEIYADDLMAWGELELALWCLNEHPNRSRWWPAWAELEALAAEWRRERAPRALPKPAQYPRETTIQREPFKTKRDWVEFCEAMVKVRDTDTQLFGGHGLRRVLLSWGEKIEARQRPYAEQRGWI